METPHALPGIHPSAEQLLPAVEQRLADARASLAVTLEELSAVQAELDEHNGELIWMRAERRFLLEKRERAPLAGLRFSGWVVAGLAVAALVISNWAAAPR